MQASRPRLLGRDRCQNMIIWFPLILLLIPIAFLILMRPSRINKIGPNAILGIRTVATTESQEAWETAHQVAWPYVKASSLALGACLIAAASGAALTEGATRNSMAGLGSAAGMVIWLVILVVGARAAHRELREQASAE